MNQESTYLFQEVIFSKQAYEREMQSDGNFIQNSRIASKISL